MGGGDLLFRFASLVQSCCGEGGALPTDIAVCGEHSPCSGHTGSAPVQGCLCFPVYTAQAPGCSIRSGPCVECGSSFPVLHKSADSVAPAFCVFPGLSGSGSQRLGALSTGAPPVGSQEVFRQDPGPGFSGAEFAPFPSPCLLPPAGMAGSSLEFLGPFVLQTAGSVFRLVNFSLLSHSLKELPPFALRVFRPGFYPK